MSTVSPQLATRSSARVERSPFAIRPEIALIVIAAVVFGQVARFPFVSWDDGPMVAANPFLHPVTLAGLKYLWTHSYYGLYMPLTYTVYTAVSALFGAGATSADFHIVNLGLHIAATILVYRLALSLGAPKSGAIAGAIVYAIHPLQVEPVSWVGSLNTELSTFFTLLCLTRYISLCVRPSDGAERRTSDYGLATFWFVCALLSKPTAVAIPLMCAVIGIGFFRGRIARIAIELVPWFAVAAVWIWITASAQPFAHDATPAPWLRPFIAGDALAFYLAKLIVPTGMAPDYARTPTWVLSHAWGYLTWLVPAACAMMAWRVRHTAPWLIACFALFVAALVPVLGLEPFAYQQFSTVADRYASAAMLAPALAIAFAFSLSGGQSRLVRFAAGAVIVALCGLSLVQASYWSSSRTLFAHGIAVSPRSRIMHYNLGTTLQREGDPDGAGAQYAIAIALDPGYAEAHCNLAGIYADRGDTTAAISAYRAAIAFDPNLAEAHYGLGLALAQLGDTRGAASEWTTTIRLWPRYAPARHNLAVALAKLADRSGAER